MIVIITGSYVTAEWAAHIHGLAPDEWIWVSTGAADRWLSRCAEWGVPVPEERILDGRVPDREAA